MSNIVGPHPFGTSRLALLILGLVFALVSSSPPATQALSQNNRPGSIPSHAANCTSIPGTPTLTAPEDWALLDYQNVMLKWNAADCASTYKVVVKDARTGQVVERRAGLTTTQYTTGALPRGRTYRWKVVAFNSSGANRSGWRLLSITPLRSGIMTDALMYADTQAPILDGMREVGARWLRFTLGWDKIQAAGPNSFDWTKYDAAIGAAQARGLKIMLLLAFTPSWAKQPSCTAKWGCAPANPQDFARFAAAAVQRYAPRGIRHYEIWNEPNIQPFWQPSPDAAQYTAVLKAAYTAIKQADPKAFVITGGTSPGGDDLPRSINSRTFLSGIYANGGKGYFDAVGHHPYTCRDYPGTAGDNAWYQMVGASSSLRTIMEDNGDGAKQIWATEYGTNTGAGGKCDVSEQKQADMLTRAYQLFSTYSWAGPLFWYKYDENCASNVNDLYGLVRRDSACKLEPQSRKPAWYAYENAATAP